MSALPVRLFAVRQTEKAPGPAILQHKADKHGQMPHCDTQMHIKDMPLQYGTAQTLEVHYHRYRCPHCGKTFSEKVPLTYPETRIPRRAAAWVKGLMRWQMPASTVQKITGIHGAKRIGYGYRDDDFLFTTLRSIPIPDLGSLSPKKT